MEMQTDQACLPGFLKKKITGDFFLNNGQWC
jgi:hypothetical protein